MAENCLFCKIVKKEIPSTVVYEDERILAFNDIDPQAPFHVIIIPKQHYDSVLAVPEGDDIISYIYTAANKIVAQLGIDKEGFRIVNNCGEKGGQTVMHMHFHLLGGRDMQWPPG